MGGWHLFICSLQHIDFHKDDNKIMVVLMSPQRNQYASYVLDNVKLKTWNELVKETIKFEVAYMQN